MRGDQPFCFESSQDWLTWDEFPEMRLKQFHLVETKPTWNEKFRSKNFSLVHSTFGSEKSRGIAIPTSAGVPLKSF